MDFYVVKAGDTLSAIAEAYSVSIEELAFLNQLVSPYNLTIGQALLIPSIQENVERPLARINGYAYPFIGSWTLQQTLPYLTELSIFSYGFTTEGILVPPMLDDTWMIQEAAEKQTLPLLTLTPFGADGQFNNYLIHVVVQSETATVTLVNELTEITQEKGFAGVDVDFE